MELSDYLFKINRNILPIVRGVIKRFFCCLRSDVTIGSKARIGKGADLVFHPRCKCLVGKGLTCGRYAMISVLPTGYLDIGEGVGIGNNNQIVCHSHIKIGDGTLFGPNVMVYDHNHQYSLDKGVSRRSFNVSEVLIGKNCWIGAGSIILMGVHIGDNCVIGAGSLVVKDIPGNSVAVGTPAKVIKQEQHGL